MKYPVIVSDLDGTLLSSANQILPYTESIFKRVTQAGYMVVLATGRHHLDVQGIALKLGISCPIVTANGALVHLADQRCIRRIVFSKPIAEELLRLGREHTGLVVGTYQTDAWFSEPLLTKEQLQGFFQYSRFLEKQYPLNQMDLTAVHKFFYSGALSSLLALEQALYTTLADEVAISFSQGRTLEVMPANVNKATGVAFLGERLGFDLADCIAFGDAMNDAELLESAGKAYVMGNAQSRLKERLPHLPMLGSADQESVAHYLEEALQLTAVV